MGAQGSKRWVEMPPGTPELQEKRISKLTQIRDPRSPMAPRTPIQLEEYDESPQNRELKLDIPDPRSPAPLIDRTPIIVAARRNSELNKNEAPDSTIVDIVDAPLEKHECKVPQVPEAESPVASVSKKDQTRLLKQTVSPADFKRQRRNSRRNSVPQKLFSEKVAPIPRSPLAQRNSIDLGGDGLKKNTGMIRKQGAYYNELGCGKENPAMNAVF